MAASSSGEGFHQVFGVFAYIAVVSVLVGLLLTIGGGLVLATSQGVTDRRATALQVRNVGISCLVVGAFGAVIGLALR